MISAYTARKQITEMIEVDTEILTWILQEKQRIELASGKECFILHHKGEVALIYRYGYWARKNGKYHWLNMGKSVTK